MPYSGIYILPQRPASYFVAYVILVKRPSKYAALRLAFGAYLVDTGGVEPPNGDEGIVSAEVPIRLTLYRIVHVANIGKKYYLPKKIPVFHNMRDFELK